MLLLAFKSRHGVGIALPCNSAAQRSARCAARHMHRVFLSTPTPFHHIDSLYIYHSIPPMHQRATVWPASGTAAFRLSPGAWTGSSRPTRTLTPPSWQPRSATATSTTPPGMSGVRLLRIKLTQTQAYSLFCLPRHLKWSLPCASTLSRQSVSLDNSLNCLGPSLSKGWLYLVDDWCRSLLLWQGCCLCSCC